MWLRCTDVNYFALSMVAATLWLGTGQYRKLADVRILTFFGYISYGLYLVHGWVFGVYSTLAYSFAPDLLPGWSFAKLSLETAICIAAATALAYLSRTTYEAYFLRMKADTVRSKALTQAA